MADLNPLSMINAALAGLGSDMKGRTDNDLSDDMLKSGANFTDVMMARVTARQNSADDYHDMQKDYAAADKVKPERADPLPYAKADDAVREPRDKAASRVVESRAARETNATSAPDDKVDWSDDRAVKGLKKLASTMLDAEKNGEITLPPAVKKILEKIAAADGTPGQILPLVQDMLVALRKLDQSASAADLKNPLGEMTWPKEITDLFNDLQVNPGVKSGQPVDLGKMIKALRTLGHLVQQMVAEKADAGSASGLMDASLLMPAVHKPVAKTADAPVDTAQKTETLPDIAGAAAVIVADGKAPQAVDALVSAAPPAVSVKDPAGTARDKPDDRKSSAMDDLMAGLAKGAKAEKPAAIAGGTVSPDRNAHAAGSSAAGAQAAQPTPFALQFENNPPTLNPMAAALSARSSFTAAAMSSPGSANGTLPHPATQQIMISLQKSPITKDTSLSIQLNPAELGRVDVKITIDQNGKASAQIVADRPETLMMLQKDSSHLEKALQQAGLNNSAQDLHYSLREQNNQQRGQEFAGQKRRRALFDTDEGLQKVTMDAPVSADGLPHRVNYHA